MLLLGMFKPPAVALIALAFTSIVSAQELKIDKYVLPNGLTVLLNENHSLPVVSVNIWYNVGSKDEPPQRSGFAHLFEHLMFMGTKRVPNGQYDRIMEAGGGQNNANTTEDRTDYFSEGPSNLIKTLLWLEADRLQDLGNSIDQKKLDLQRDVVKNERRQNTENTPYGKAYEAIPSILYPVGHPYHNSVIGSMEDLDRASVKDVQDFFATYYVPNNAVLAVAGDFDPKEIKPYIASLFGAVQRKSDPIHALPSPIQMHGVRRVTFVDKVQASKVVMVWHSPVRYQPGDAEMELTGAILSDGLTSRLYQRLVVKDKLVSDISAGQDSKALGSQFYVDATVTPGVSLSKVEAAIDSELRRFVTHGPTSDELKRQASKIEFGLVNSLQSAHSVAEHLVEFEALLGNPNPIKWLMKRYQSATPDSVRQVASKVLDPNARAILHIIPESEDAKAQVLDQRPVDEGSKPFKMPHPQYFTLSNGMKVTYWSKRDLPLITLSMSLKRGADSDPVAKSGRTSLMTELLDEGAGPYSGEAFHKNLDILGAQFSASATQGRTVVTLSSLSSKFEPALKLYAEAVLRPRFEASAIERVRRVTAESLEQELEDPSTIAKQVGLREFFGNGNPLAHPVGGTPHSVRALGAADIKQAYENVFQAQNAHLFAAGSLPATSVKAMLEKQFGSWKLTGKPAATTIYPAAPKQNMRVVIVNRPGAVQTVVGFYAPGVTYADPNRDALASFSTILGGTFTSRLNQNLREAKGYTYGAGSRFTFNPQVGYFYAGAAVRADVTGASLKEFLSEFKKIQKGDITPEEAMKAASIRRNDLVSGLGTLSGIVGAGIDYDFLGVPFTQVDVDLKKIASVGVDDLNHLAATAVDLDHTVLILVGDETVIKKQLAGLELPVPQTVEP